MQVDNSGDNIPFHSDKRRRLSWNNEPWTCKYDSPLSVRTNHTIHVAREYQWWIEISVIRLTKRSCTPVTPVYQLNQCGYEKNLWNIHTNICDSDHSLLLSSRMFHNLCTRCCLEVGMLSVNGRNRLLIRDEYQCKPQIHTRAGQKMKRKAHKLKLKSQHSVMRSKTNGTQ